MTNNDVLRRIRYILDLDDSSMIAQFGKADFPVTRAQISDWLKKNDDDAQQKLSDKYLAIFLNGLIIDRRGKKDGEQPKLETRITNNIILMKLKIALNLKGEDLIDILNLVDMHPSKHEISALFRKPGHKHYRECKDQFLRSFLQGLQIKYRGDNKPNVTFDWKTLS